MAELRTIETAPGWCSTPWSRVRGCALVLLLYGFAGSFHTWRSQVAALAAAGCRAVAPEPAAIRRARPDLATPELSHGWLVADAMACRRRGAATAAATSSATTGAPASPGISRAAPGAPRPLIAVATASHAFNRAPLEADAAQAQRSQHHTAPGAGGGGAHPGGRCALAARAAGPIRRSGSGDRAASRSSATDRR
jgi:hypothetical protein